MNEPRVAIYPGTFDPLTLGHEDIARRSLKFVDQLVLAVAHHPTHQKNGLFSVDEKIEMIEECFADEPRIEVKEFSGLLVAFCRRIGARIVVRGLRAVSDFEYEFQMALMNREMAPEIEEIFLTAEQRYIFLSSSLVKEVASLGGNVGEFVAPSVEKILSAHYRRGG